MTRLGTRLAKLEQRTAPDAPRYYTLWDDEPVPADARSQDLIVRCYHKSPSPEAWAAAVRQRNPEWFAPREA